MQADAYPGFTKFTDLGLSPVALHLGPFDLRWYSLAYLSGIFIGYWYLLKLLKEPGAPLGRRHADDLVFYAALGIILGGRMGYVLFYNFGQYLRHPIEILKLWDGGMSFHGGVIGTSLGILYFAHKEKLSWLRIHDYVACCVPFGLFFGRLANFVNQELWGAQTSVPWAIRFVEITPYGAILGPPRHPSQLYEAVLEGVGEVLLGNATPVQIAGFAVALRSKGETVAEMQGLVDAMYAHAPCSVLQRAMHIHPTVSELIPTLLGELAAP